MKVENGVPILLSSIYLYLDGLISGRQLVKNVDRLVASGSLVKVSDQLKSAFDKLHESMAMCIWDKQTYNDSDGIYVSEDELRKDVKNFVAKYGADMSKYIMDEYGG